MQTELSTLVIHAHRDWQTHKKRIEEIITEYNKISAQRNGANSNEKDKSEACEEEPMIENCEYIIRECVKQVEFHLGDQSLKQSKESLVELITHLVIERSSWNDS